MNVCSSIPAVNMVTSEAYSEPCQTFKMEIFAKTVHEFTLLAIFAKTPPQIFDMVRNTSRTCFY